MLKQIGTNIWIGEQKQKYWGLEVGTRMTIIRLTDNQLSIVSPIKLDLRSIEEIDNIGEVAFIIAPNLYHYLYLEDASAIYPQAQILAPPGLAEKKPQLKIDLVLTEDQINFNNEIEYFAFQGFRVFEVIKTARLNEIIFFHPKSKTLILTDTAFHFDETFPRSTQVISQIIGGYRQLSPSLLEKIAIEDKNSIEKSIQKILTWDFQRVIMAHGSIIEKNARERLKIGYEWFLDKKI
jgi:hypothetical protein